MFGNLLYTLALDLNAPFLLFLGRFCIGVGGSRVINRRYIADTVSVSERTKFSAAFVAAGSLGMALGPFVAGGMTYIDLKAGWLTINHLTAPSIL